MLLVDVLLWHLSRRVEDGLSLSFMFLLAALINSWFTVPGHPHKPQ